MSSDSNSEERGKSFRRRAFHKCEELAWLTKLTGWLAPLLGQGSSRPGNGCPASPDQMATHALIEESLDLRLGPPCPSEPPTDLGRQREESVWHELDTLDCQASIAFSGLENWEELEDYPLDSALVMDFQAPYSTSRLFHQIWPAG